MKDTTELKQTILQQLRPGIRIGITTHIEPDGDGFCAALALQIYLRTKGLESRIITDESNLERFGFLMQAAQIQQFSSGMQHDLLFVLDCNSFSRLGERRDLVNNAGYTIVIDHHMPEDGVIPADFSYVDVYAVSVGAIIFRTLKDEIEALPETSRILAGNCLYTTILNDSNNFTNANTTAETFQISAELTGLGITPSELYRQYFLNHSPGEMRYVGEVLSTLELYYQDRILFIHSTLEMLQRNGLTAESIMSVTRWVQGVKGVDVIAYLREEAPEYYKLSLRSPILDVNEIASGFGGGGHKKASGANVSGALPAIRQNLVSILTRALEVYDAGK